MLAAVGKISWSASSRDTVWKPVRCSIKILRPFCSSVLNLITFQKKMVWEFWSEIDKVVKQAPFLLIFAEIFSISLLATPRHPER